MKGLPLSSYEQAHDYTTGSTASATPLGLMTETAGHINKA
jgi:hypothetical protein